MRGVINIFRISNICVLLIFLNGFAQVPDTAWTKIYGGIIDEVAGSIQQTVDSGYILAGYCGEEIYGQPLDIFLMKTDNNGDTIWTRFYGGSQDDIGYSAIQTSDSGYVIVGSTESEGAGGKDVFIIRTNEYGDPSWTRVCGGADDDEGFSVIETVEGSYLVAGYTSSFGAVAGEVYLIKININGDTLWTKNLGAEGSIARSIASTSDGGYIITGSISVDSFSNSAVYLLKIDESGDTLWTRSYGGFQDHGNDVQQTSDGGYVIAGTGYTEGFLEPYGYLIKTDSLANLQWTTPLVPWGLTDVEKTAAGEFLATGGNYDPSQVPVLIELAVVKVDSNGDTLWTEIFEGAVGKSLALSNDGGFIIAADHIIYGCYYPIGDVNGSGNYNGLDITFGVSYFMHESPLPLCPSCPHSPDWYFCGDVNGSDSYNGVDITYGVTYFRGGPYPISPPSFPSGGNTDVYLLKFNTR